MGYLTAERVALAAAGLALCGTMTAPVIAEAVKAESPPPTTKTCLELESDYASAIRRSSEDRERILPGVDGKSTLLTSPQAQHRAETASGTPLVDAWPERPEIVDAPHDQLAARCD
jgi:hypothetical protein